MMIFDSGLDLGHPVYITYSYYYLVKCLFLLVLPVTMNNDD